MKRIPAFAIALLLAGCASAPAPNCVRLARNGWFCPLPPAALAPASGTDLVTVTRKGRTQHYLGQLVIGPQYLRLALASLAGVPLATITWDGHAARVRPAKSGLHPGLMTALLELTLAPPQALQRNLHGLTLRVRENRNGIVRTLRTATTLVARARTHGGVTRIEVPRARLTVRLQPVGGADK